MVDDLARKVLEYLEKIDSLKNYTAKIADVVKETGVSEDDLKKLEQAGFVIISVGAVIHRPAYECKKFVLSFADACKKGLEFLDNLDWEYILNFYDYLPNEKKWSLKTIFTQYRDCILKYVAGGYKKSKEAELLLYLVLKG